MSNFYLTSNIANNEPECIKSIDYIHIKAKTDGSQTIILTTELINNESCIVLSKEEAQNLVDQWISEENSNPPIDPINNTEMIQSYIDLDLYVN